MGLAQVLIPGSQLIPMPLGLANQGLSLRPVSPAHPMLSGSSSCLCLEGSICLGHVSITTVISGWDDKQIKTVQAVETGFGITPKTWPWVFSLLISACRLHPYCCANWEKSKCLEKSGSWKIAKDINNMPDRSALRNKWPRSKYGPSYLFPPASAAFFLPLNILSEVPRAKLNGGLKKKSVNAKPRGGRSFSLASRSLPG